MPAIARVARIVGLLGAGACLPAMLSLSIGCQPRDGLALIGTGPEGAADEQSTGSDSTGARPRTSIFGPIVQSAIAPLPISGGTLLVLRNGATAVCSDPERDFVAVVDLSTETVRALVKLQPSDEPGRLVEDARGLVHVVLRRGGALVAIDPAAGVIVRRTPVCPSPRGLAFSERDDTLVVACLDGELIRIPSAGGSPTSIKHIDSDLRDVVVTPGGLFVSRFRSAQLLRLGADDAVTSRIDLPGFQSPLLRKGEPFAARVAWRALAVPGGIAVVHQRAQTSSLGKLVVSRGYYTGSAYLADGGGSVVHGAISFVPAAGGPVAAAAALETAVLPVDLAVSPDGRRIAVVAAGNATPANVEYSDIGVVKLPAPVQVVSWQVVTGGSSVAELDETPWPAESEIQPVAIAFDGKGRMVVQSREPAVLQIEGAPPRSIVLSSESRADTGHLIFHGTTGSSGNIACASCHAEAGDDGHVWDFAEGTRRTPPLRGGLANRAPYHWDGGQPTMATLATMVYYGRMSGPYLDELDVNALRGWLETVPHLPPQPVTDAAAVARGRALFQSPGFACGGCHTDGGGAPLDVGTGGSFKAPSLRSVAWRTPLMHNGVASTLADRFGPRARHAAPGNPAELPPSQVNDLVSYLRSL